MRRLSVFSVCLAIAIATTSLSGVAGASSAGSAPVFYLSLGDSLAQGVQPGPGGGNVLTDQGYPDQLYPQLKKSDPGLVLVKLGCPGESSTTMIHGGLCPYRTSQLADAAQFLATHRGQVKFLTMNIGSNDLLPCVLPTGVDVTCVTTAFRLLGANLAVIAATLRTAAGPTVTAAGMTYYDPVLAAFPADPQLAAESVVATHTLNMLETRIYTGTGFRVAHVGTAFRTYTFTVEPGTALPANVLTICTLTWMCSVGNIHPNAAGYAEIAKTFLRTLRAPAAAVADGSE